MNQEPGRRQPGIPFLQGGEDVKEHCPDEMTPEQIANWERHQQAVYNTGAKP